VTLERERADAATRAAARLFPWSHRHVLTTLLNSLLFLPVREIRVTPAHAGMAYEDVTIETEDGQRLHGWWVPASARAASSHDAAADPATGHLLLCHGNAGNIGDRVMHAALLCAAGFDVLLFDYRGYGRSTGRPDEPGTYRDAHAAQAALLARPHVDPTRVFYLGESLGGAVALELALDHPPAGLVLMSTFTSVRDMARKHYAVVPASLVPDAYPSLRRVKDLRTALLVLHGDRDDIVPLFHAEELFRAAPHPKHLRIIEGVGHNDLVTRAGPAWATAIRCFSATMA
jgi:uncharacterized protein